VFVGVFFPRVVAAVAGVDLAAAAEAEPAVGFGIVLALAAVGQFGAGGDAQVLLLALGREGPVDAAVVAGDAEEFELGQLEGQFVVAFAADAEGGFAAHGGDACAGGVGGRAFGARGQEGRGEHVGDGAAVEVEVAGFDGVGVHGFRAVADGEGAGALVA